MTTGDMSMRRKHCSLIRALRTDPRVLQRFWKQVLPSANANDCWEWIGGRTPAGNPSFRIGGRSVAASHVMWFTAVGELPEGGRVKRQCGNTQCVRPTHLAWALSPMLERAVESLDDGYVALAGHAFVPDGGAPPDPRSLRAAVAPTGSSPDAAQRRESDTGETADAA